MRSLACRPMLPLALAVAAGVLAGRFFPFVAEHAAAGAFVFAAALFWFCLRPARAVPFAPDAALLKNMPPQYLPHIIPSPGFIARRGTGIFLLILCIGCFALAAWRQGIRSGQLNPGRLPIGEWTNAVFTADTPNRSRESPTGRWRIAARIASLDGNPDAAGQSKGISVRLYSAAEMTIRRGDIVKATVRFSRPRPPAFPGAFDSAFWLERDGLAANANVFRNRNTWKPEIELVPVDNPSFLIRARRVLDSVRAAAIERTLRHGGEHGALLAAMLYGYREEVDNGLTDAFRRVGIGHVLAISGLHVGLVIGLLWWLTGWLPWSSRARSSVCLVAAIAYLGLSGGQVAAARATLMAVIHLGARACGRRSDMLNSLGAAAFFIILHNPSAPLDVSFQLSFTAVVFIYIALSGRGRARRERNARNGRNAGNPRSRFFAELDSLARLSVATWIGLYPIAAHVFHQVNLIGLPLNVAVIPMMGAVLAGGLLLPVLGWIPGAPFVLTLPSRALTVSAFFSDSLPYSSFSVHSPSGRWIAVFYAFVFLSLANRMVPDPAKRGKWLLCSLIGIAVSLAGVTLSMASSPPPSESRLALLPGNGLGVIAAETPDGKIALVGQIRRQGLDEANWLHFLRRGGEVSVVSIGAGKRDTLEGLDFHNRVASRKNFPLTAKRLANAPPEWTPVPGADGIEFAFVRNGRGRAAALLVKAGDRLLASASRPGERDGEALSAFLEENEREGLDVFLRGGRTRDVIVLAAPRDDPDAGCGSRATCP